MKTHGAQRGLVLNGMAILIAAALAGCGGGGGGGGGDSGGGGGGGVTSPSGYALAGSVSGLPAGASLSLSSGGTSITVGGNGDFSFPGTVPNGSSYNVGVTPPAGYTCAVINGSGVIAGAAPRISVTCAPAGQAVAGQRSSIQAMAGMVTDSSGNSYVIDPAQHIILKIAPSGSVSTFAGTKGVAGSTDGAGTTARFNFASESRLAIGPDGSLGVTDTCNGLIRKVAPDGTTTTLAGHPYDACTDARVVPLTTADGTGAAAQFVKAQEIISDGAGGFLVTDLAHTDLRTVSAAGTVTSAPWPGSIGGAGTMARDQAGNIYVVDQLSRIYKLVGNSAVLLAGGMRPAGATPVDGTGTAATFQKIRGMTAHSDGNLYVADTQTVRKVTPAGVVTTIAGNPSKIGTADGTGSAAEFVWLSSISVDAEGNLIAADAGQNALRKITRAGVVTTLGATPSTWGTLDGLAGTAKLTSLSQPAVDAEGNVYLADSTAHIIRKVTPTGAVSRLTGTMGVAGTADNNLASATFTTPSAVAAAPNGALYVAQDVGVRRIAGGVVSTVSKDARVLDLAVDADGSLAASANAFLEGGAIVPAGVYRFTPAGVRTVLVAKAAVAAVIGRAEAEFNFMPQGLAYDSAGNLYIADTGTAAVYKLSKAGVLTKFAGTPLVEGDADGAQGTGTLRAKVMHMTIDGNGNLFISNRGKMRKVSAAGVLSTPQMGWGEGAIHGLAFGSGRLFGLTAWALLHTNPQ